jgi:MoaA/NifB/PqqE/SkfB family radical SAM enzyme
LHGTTAAVSDAITEAPGTFEQTLGGLDALVKAGVSVQTNFVICHANMHELEAWVALVPIDGRARSPTSRSSRHRPMSCRATER